MAVNLLSDEVSDICIGKPALRSFPVSATIGEALSTLKKSGECFLSIWSCDHQHSNSATTATVLGAGGKVDGECKCLGKISIVDIVCFLCKDGNLQKPSIALESPISVIIMKVPELVKHLDPHTRLFDAINCILAGAQNLVIPIKKSRYPKLSPKESIGFSDHNGKEFCWITQEDVARYFFNSIHRFSPIPSYSIEQLNIVDHNILALQYDEPALSALPAIQTALATQTALAVVDAEEKLIGEISPQALAYFDETLAAAIAALSIGDFMAYVDCTGPPDDLVILVKERLEEKNLTGLLELSDECSISSFSSFSSSSSSDEEFGMGARFKHGGNSGRMFRNPEAVICYPESTFAAVMAQVLAHRVNYAWVVESDHSIVGIVTLADMLKVFRDRTGPFC